MTKLCLYIILVVLLNTMGWGQIGPPQPPVDTIHIETFGSSSSEVFKDIDRSGDYFYVIGSDNVCGSLNFSIYVFDDSLNVINNISYGSRNFIESGEAVEVVDDRIYIAGYTNETVSGSYNPIVLEIDSFGIVVNRKTIEKSSWTVCNDIIATSSGNLIGVGRKFSSSNSWDAYIFCMNDSLDVIWEKTIGGSREEELLGICTLNDSVLVACGSTSSQGKGMKDVYLVAFDTIGDTLWTSAIGGVYDDFGNNIIQTRFGELAIIGTTTSDSTLSEEPYLVKTNELGQLQWTSLGNAINSESNRGIDLAQKPNGDYVVFAYFESDGVLGIKDFSITKVSPNGTWLGDADYFGAQDDQPFAGKRLKGGQFIFVGSLKSYGQGFDDGFIGTFFEPVNAEVTIDENFIPHNCFDTMNVSIGIIEHDKDYSLYPNPFGIDFSIDAFSMMDIKIELYDLTGKLVWGKRVFNTGSPIQVPYEIADGIYSLKIAGGSVIRSQLIVRTR